MASKKISGIIIEIGGETTKLGKALEGAEKQSKSLQSELKGVNTLLKLDPSNVDLLKQKQELLTKSIASTEDKLKTLNITMSQIKSGKIEATEEQFRDLQREIVSTEQKLDKLEEEAKSFGTVFEQLTKVASKKMQEIGSEVEEVGKKLGGISAGATAGLGTAITMASSLEDAVNKYLGATGKSIEETEKYQEVLKNIHDGNYGEDYADIADKMRIVSNILGDLPQDKLQNIVEKSYMLEDAYDMDFQENIRGVNALMDQFGITADQAYELINQGAQKGLNQNQDLTDQIAEYSTYYAKLGFTAEDFFNMMIAGAENGAYQIDYLNDAMKEFGIRTKDNSKSTNEAYATLGLDVEKINNQFAQGGDKAQEAFAKVTQAIMAIEDPVKRNEVGVALFGTKFEDLEESAVFAMTSAKDQVNMLGETVKTTSETMYGGTANKAQTALREIKTAFAELGEVILPLITPIIEKVTLLIQKFNELSPTVKKIIVAVTGIVAVLSPALIIVGKIITAVSTIIPVIGKIWTGLTKLAPVFNFIKTAVTGLFSLIMAHPVIAIITAIIATIVLLWNKCDWFRNAVITAWEFLKNAFQVAFEWLGNLFVSIGEFFVNLWTQITTIFGNIGTWFDTYLVQPISLAFQAIMNFINQYIIQPLLTLWNDYIYPIITKIIEIITKVVEIIFNIYKGVAIWIYQNVIQPIVNFVIELYQKVVEIFTSIWNKIVSIFTVVATWVKTNVITPVASAITYFKNKVVEIFSAIWDKIVSVFSKVASWVKSTIITPVTNAVNSFKNKAFEIFSSIWDKISSVFGAVGSWFKNKFTEAYNGIKSVFSKIPEFFSGIWSKISSTFSNLGTKIGDAIGGAVKSGINGVISFIERTINSAIGLINGAINLINKLPGVSVGKISTLSLPRLATGDVAEPNKPYLAMLGDNKTQKEVISPVDTMRDTFMDALTDFTNIRSQGNSEIKTLTNLMNKYMPQIISNMGQSIVLDDNTLVGKLTPKIDASLGELTMRRRRGY